MKSSIFPFFIAIILVLITFSTMGQNLVPNGDFEYKKGRRNSSKPWRFVNTVDFYVTKGKIKRPSSTEDWNIPKPKSGAAFLGIRIYPKYREFVQIKLAKKLVEGKRYYFEMWISWSDHSNMYAKSFGASIYRKKPSYTSDYFIFTMPPQIELKNEGGIHQSDSSQWVKVSGMYRAKGGEKYLSIGNFSTTHKKDRFKSAKAVNFRFWHHEAYYFVDQVSLVRMEEYSVENDSILVGNIPDSAIVDKNDNYIYQIEKDSSLVINNIQFASAEVRLLPRSFKDLELILEYLNENQDKQVQIIGFTDNIGSTSANQKLSEKRAKAVYDYFITNYIDKSRISYIGKGESDPIASNDDNLGRRKNRRVELKLIN